MKRNARHIWGFFAAALLWGCSGGAGPGAALDGGGAGGGPVGGGNFAAGPVSLPAPTVVAPNHPVEWVHISCTNVPGPNFECRGNTRSVPPQTEIQFSIYEPAAAVPRDSFTVVAGADGSWLASHEGVAGESIEICPKVGGVCRETRLFKLPPTGGTVDGSQGTMKNLVIDPQGNSWHSRWLPRLSLRRLLASLWVSEAKAQDRVVPFTPVSCDRSAIVLEAVPPPDAPRCFLYRAARGDVASARSLSFEDCEQTDIHAIVPTQVPTLGTPLLLVAVKHRLYWVDIAREPTIFSYYSFPNPITAVLDQGGGRFIVATKAGAEDARQPLFFVDLNVKGAAGAGCYAVNDFVRGLNGITSSDSLNGAFAMVAYNSAGQYQVFAGRTRPDSVVFRNAPFPLRPASAHPLEVKILQVENEYIYVAILNAAEKKITLIRRYQPTADVIVLDAPADQVQEISLEGLNVEGVGPLRVSRPQLFNVNRSTRELVFVDISEQESKLVTVPYAYARGAWAPVASASTVSLGNAAPASLRRDGALGDAGGWAYNSGDLRIMRVRTPREQTVFQLMDSPALREATTERVYQIYEPDTAGNEGDDEE